MAWSQNVFHFGSNLQKKLQITALISFSLGGSLGFDLAHFFGDWSQSESLSEIKPPLVKKNLPLSIWFILHVCYTIVQNTWQLPELAPISIGRGQTCQSGTVSISQCTVVYMYLQSTCFHLTIFFFLFFCCRGQSYIALQHRHWQGVKKKEDFFCADITSHNMHHGFFWYTTR